MGEVIEAAYTDSGLLGRNPSPHGCSWAYCLVTGDRLVRGDAGVVTAAEAGVRTTSNNYGELFAAAMALLELPDGWDGVFHTDSQVTLQRLAREDARFNKVPQDLRELVRAELRRLGAFRVVLVAGHPSRAHLAAGTKKGLPVSRWNVWCDEACARAGAEFLDRFGLPATAEPPRGLAPARRYGGPP